ncbi:hypothetical protein KCU83_g271, partial [Aureobasidium melanogenum]
MSTVPSLVKAAVANVECLASASHISNSGSCFERNLNSWSELRNSVLRILIQVEVDSEWRWQRRYRRSGTTRVFFFCEDTLGGLWLPSFLLDIVVGIIIDIQGSYDHDTHLNENTTRQQRVLCCFPLSGMSPDSSI